ncbi:MAG: HD domain-containing protein [bacterium]
MIRKAFILKIFDAAYMQRWNDKIRPIELIELDKQAHKMVIAYFFSKFEEHTPEFNWIDILEGGVFELLQRIVVTDLKPPIFFKIKQDTAKYKRLNEWVYYELEPIMSPLGHDFGKRFREYFSSGGETLNKRILGAAHLYATKWEFDIIKGINPNALEMRKIENDLQARLSHFYDLKGVAELEENKKYQNFIDLCGHLRFQARWAHLHRIPKTSVLGHMLFVAILSYLFSLEIKSCRRRCMNNYFTGLFHDLPEALTRDIISPVKRSIEGLSDLIKEYEKEEMNKEVYGLIPKEWASQIKMFTENEFDNVITIEGKSEKVVSLDLHDKYNEDKFNPRDGELVKAADELSAFIEAYLALVNGSTHHDLQEARLSLKNKYARVNIAGMNFGELYADFD